MIYSVTGEIMNIEQNLAVIESNGVGFACRTSSMSLEGLKVGDKTTFRTYMHVREDAIELFGFASEYELNHFKMLLSISGVGPKNALAVLSEMSPQDFAMAVVSDDVKALTRVSGIGTKTAQLIILKLKDKLSKEPLKETSVGGKSSVSANSGGEAMSALMVLGFTAAEAATALSDVPNELSTSEKIKSALKKLSNKQ